MDPRNIKYYMLVFLFVVLGCKNINDYNTIEIKTDYVATPSGDHYSTTTEKSMGKKFVLSQYVLEIYNIDLFQHEEMLESRCRMEHLAVGKKKIMARCTYFPENQEHTSFIFDLENKKALIESFYKYPDSQECILSRSLSSGTIQQLSFQNRDEVPFY
ncbi:MAG: hypothetical protein AAGB24_15625 [Bacteroidota bacterium]